MKNYLLMDQNEIKHLNLQKNYNNICIVYILEVDKKYPEKLGLSNDLLYLPDKMKKKLICKIK